MIMKSHVLTRSPLVFVLRKLLVFNTTFGLTLPKDFVNALGLDKSSYVKLSFESPGKIVIQRFEESPGKGILKHD